MPKNQVLKKAVLVAGCPNEEAQKFLDKFILDTTVYFEAVPNVQKPQGAVGFVKNRLHIFDITAYIYPTGKGFTPELLQEWVDYCKENGVKVQDHR